MDDTVGDHQKALSHLSWPKAEGKESGTPSRVQFRLRSGQRRGSFPGIIKGTFAFFLRVLTCIFRIITNFQLEKRVQFHEHLRPVCLPTANTQLIPGTLCTVIGWGKKNDTDSMYLKILKGLVICSNQIGLPNSLRVRISCERSSSSRLEQESVQFLDRVQGNERHRRNDMCRISGWRKRRVSGKFDRDFYA